MRCACPFSIRYNPGAAKYLVLVWACRGQAGARAGRGPGSRTLPGERPRPTLAIAWEGCEGQGLDLGARLEALGQLGGAQAARLSGTRHRGHSSTHGVGAYPAWKGSPRGNGDCRVTHCVLPHTVAPSNSELNEYTKAQ